MTIIQRLTAALKAQAWGALTLEMVVLTLGIFLAFQVDRWYESYRDGQLVSEYVTRLKGNLQSDIDILDDIVRTSTLRESNVDLLARSLTDPSVVDDAPTQFVIALEQATYRFQLVAADATYQELLSTGHMMLLPAATRGLLYEYYGHHSAYRQFDPAIDAVQAQAFERFAGIIPSDLFSARLLSPAEQQDREYTQAEARAAAERFWQNDRAIAWLGRLKQTQIQIGLQSEVTRDLAMSLVDHLEGLGS